MVEQLRGVTLDLPPEPVPVKAAVGAEPEPVGVAASAAPEPRSGRNAQGDQAARGPEAGLPGELGLPPTEQEAPHDAQ